MHVMRGLLSYKKNILKKLIAKESFAGKKGKRIEQKLKYRRGG